MISRLVLAFQPWRNGLALRLAATILCVAGAVASCGPVGNAPASRARATLASRPKTTVNASRAFLTAYPVFMHPRCINCHPEGNRPLQDDDTRLHSQNVQRGPEGHGKYALRCSNCHPEANTGGENMPPGAPNWHMPPADTPMVFEGRTPAELCRALKDPERNGGMDTEDLLLHVSNDPLVLWGWDPGKGRSLPPLDHEEFVHHMRQWIETGAACPE